MVNSTTPRFGPRWPPFLETASIRNALISPASVVSSSGVSALTSRGLQIDSSSVIWCAPHVGGSGPGWHLPAGDRESNLTSVFRAACAVRCDVPPGMTKASACPVLPAPSGGAADPSLASLPRRDPLFPDGIRQRPLEVH